MGEDGNAHLGVEDEWGALNRGSDIWSIDPGISSTNHLWMSEYKM